MSERYPIPPAGGVHRGIYDRATRQGFYVDAFHAQVDTAIGGLHEQARFYAQIGEPAEEVAKGLRPPAEALESDIHEFLRKERAEFTQETGEPFRESMASLRLGLLARTAEQHVIWPAMAAYGRKDPTAEQIRAELAESLYGVTADYLDFLMSRSSFYMNFAHGVYRGSVNEFTALGLLNRKAGANRIALLGSLSEDYDEKTDMHHYRFNGDPHELIDTKVQVKSRHSIFQSLGLYSLRHIKVITAEDMGNYDAAMSSMNYRTAKDMVAEVHNRPGSEFASRRLDSILAKQAFRSIINDK